MDEYYMYLRKSRADREAELKGEGETLARHEKTLTELAEKLHLPVSRIFREIVSGETISARPQIQLLLKEVEQGHCSGVLVMEIERLARGNTKDQGTISDAFKYGNVKIITPLKTYDPSDEFDEEYFEFGLFMSRREYKTINRRIQRGRLASSMEGKWIYGTAPYGYRRVQLANEKGYTLEPVPEEAEVYRYILELYKTGELQADGTYKRLGFYLISRKLDELQIPTRTGGPWSRSTVKDILSNPVYAGKVRWKWRPYTLTVENGIAVKHRVKDKNCTLYDGLHPALCTWEEFQEIQYLINSVSSAPVKNCCVLKNPLSGLVYCRKCGKLMTRISSNTKAGYDVLKCSNPDCDNISAPIYLIEKALLAALEKWLSGYILNWDSNLALLNPNQKPSLKAMALEHLSKEAETIETQLEHIYSLLEQGIYTTDLFLKRKELLTTKFNHLKSQIDSFEKELDSEKNQHNTKCFCLTEIKKIPDLYLSIDDISLRNCLLKELLYKAEFLKTERGKRGQRDKTGFELILYPKLPKPPA